MEYLWIAGISLAVALCGNRFFAGSGYSLVVDLALALAGGLGTALLFQMTPIAAEVGLIGVMIFAIIGAGLLMLVRRSTVVA